MSLSPITDILDRLQNQPGWEQVRDWQQIVSAWRDTVSPPIASQTQPKSLQRGVLTISTTSSSLAHQLTFQRRSLCRQLNERLTSVIHPLRDLRFVPTGEVRPSNPAVSSTAKNLEIEETAEKIKNCPGCDLRTPTIELQRWGVCRFCAIDRGIIG
jgi:predicted nucleic acid-binding Zn ribbon protein